MGVNKTPGQSASGFRLYIDNKIKGETAKFEEVVVGAIFNKGGIEYTVKEMLDNMMVKLEGMNGLSVRTTIVDIAEICKSGSEYELHKDEDV